MKEYVTRLMAEEKQLRGRITRLARFVDECGPEIPGDELLLLGEQLRHMVCYHAILLQRIDMHTIRG